MKNKILCAVTLYNCENHIVNALTQLLCYEKFFDKIIIVDNCSQDNSVNKALQFIKTHKCSNKFSIFQNYQNYGLGGSHKTIFKFSQDNNFTHVVIFHGDNQGKIFDVIPYLQNPKLLNDYDVLLGSRFMKASAIKGYSKFRVFGNYLFNFIYSIALWKKITDMGSGLNVFNMNKLPKNLLFMPDDLTFNNCFLINLSVHSKKSYFFPISWIEDGQVSNAKLFSQSLKLLKYALFFIFFRDKFKTFDFRENKNFLYKFKKIKDFN